MGLFSREQPVVLLFDLGMARMYTDGESDVCNINACIVTTNYLNNLFTYIKW